MSIESAADWAGLRAAAVVTRLTRDALEARVRPGVTTGELDAVPRRPLRGAGRAVGAAARVRLSTDRADQHQRRDRAWHHRTAADRRGRSGEPRISAGSSRPVQDADGWTLRTSDGSLAAHREHTPW